MKRSPAPSRRLDWILLGLRWLLTLSAAAALVTLHSSSSNANANLAFTATEQTVTGIAVLYNIFVGFFILFDLSDRLLRPLTLLGDVILALLFFWASGESPLVMVGVSLFPILISTLRYGRALGLATASGAGFLAVILVASSPNFTPNLMVSLFIGLLFLFVTVLLTSLVSALSANDNKLRAVTLDEREIEANRLRGERARARAIYEMASTLSATLDYNKVLNAVLDLGSLGLRNLDADDQTDNGLIGVVLLYEHAVLRVETGRRLTRQDERVHVPGQRGILGLALKQTQPVFGADAHHDPELQYFSGFAAAKSILAIPLRAGYEHFGILVFGSETRDAFSDEHVELLNALSIQATIALQNAYLYLKLRQEKDKIIDAEDEARKNLARQLHDGPTQIVAAITMHINYIRMMLKNQFKDTNVDLKDAMEELQKVEDMARNVTKDVRHMLFTLRPLALETQGLTPALKQLANKMKETYNQNVVIESAPEADSLFTPQAQGILFYIIEEAVNNARKHAQAPHIYVRLFRSDDLAVIEVQDDGLGFDLQSVTSDYESRGSLGLVNMRERAAMAEGTLQMFSARGEGTKITVFVQIKGEEPTAPSQPPPTPLARIKTTGRLNVDSPTDSAPPRSSKSSITPLTPRSEAGTTGSRSEQSIAPRAERDERSDSDKTRGTGTLRSPAK